MGTHEDRQHSDSAMAKFRMVVVLNQTIRDWYRLELLEETLPVCSERSRASSEPEGQARRWFGGLRLCSDMFRPSATESTTSEEVYESRVVRFRSRAMPATMYSSRYFSRLRWQGISCSLLPFFV